MGDRRGIRRAAPCALVSVLLVSVLVAMPAHSAPAPSGGSTVIAGTPNATGIVSLVATETSGPNYLQVLPCGTAPGAYSNLNVDRAGQTIATLAFVRFDASGRACVYNQTGTHVVADLQGYMNTGAFDDVTDVRLVDTRTTSRPGNGGSTTITGRANATGIVSLVATDTTGPSYLQVLPCGATPGAYSNLNVDGAGQTIATLAFVRFDASGRACIYNQTASHVVADLQGYMNTGAFDDITDVRLVDTRQTGVAPGANGSTLLTGRPNATGIVSLVATETTGPNYLQVLPCGATPGAYSNLNVDRAGQTIATLAFVRFDATGQACVYNQTASHVVADLQGYMNIGAFDDITDIRLVDTRTTAKAKVAITQVLTGFEYRGSTAADAFPLSSAFVSIPAVPLTFTATDVSPNTTGTPACTVDASGGLLVAASVPSLDFTCGITASAAATATTEAATATYQFVVRRISLTAAVIGVPTKVNLGGGDYQVDFVVAFTPPRPGSVRFETFAGTCATVNFTDTYDATLKRFAISTRVTVPPAGCKIIVANNLNDQFTGTASVTVDVP